MASDRLQALGRRLGIPDGELAAMAKRSPNELRALLAKYGISQQEVKDSIKDLERRGENLVKDAQRIVLQQASKAKPLTEKFRAKLVRWTNSVSDDADSRLSAAEFDEAGERHPTGSQEVWPDKRRPQPRPSLSFDWFRLWRGWVAELRARWWNWLLELLSYLVVALKRLLRGLLWLLLIACLCALALWLVPHVMAIPPDLLPWTGLAVLVAALILAVLILGWATIRRWLSRLASFLLSVLTGRFLLKLLAYLLAMALFALSASVLHYRHEVKILNELKALVQVDPLPEAKVLVADGKYCDALEYLDFYREYDYVRDNAEIAAYYDQVKRERDSWWFSIRDAFEGIWKGKGACCESLVAATVSDFFIVGDLRDLILEGTKWYEGRENDEFVVALAAAEVVLSAPTYAGGAGAPVKGSLSLLKVAKRLGRVPAPLQKELVTVFRETARMRSIEPIRPLADHISSLKEVQHLKASDFLEMLSRCSSVSDLKQMKEAGLAYGNKTGKVMKLGGNAPLEMLRKCGGDVNLSKAMDQSLQYGRKGTQILGELGSTRFLRLLTLAKYGARAGRSLWQHRLTLLAAWLLGMLPEGVIWMALIASGLVVIGWPAVSVSRFLRRGQAGV